MNNEIFIAFVIITRNEQAHIAECIESALAAAKNYSESSVVLVDSDSTDRTVSIAKQYPIAIYRYKDAIHTAAAGRRIGFESISSRYVFFLDGDCLVNPEWLKNALITLDENPSVAVTFGGRRDIFSDHANIRDNDILDGEGCTLGGNALYRSEALTIAGNFNPYLAVEEEAELLGRLQLKGFLATPTSGIMVTHYTVPKGSYQSIMRRQKLGLYRGHGHILRLSVTQGLFSYHMKRFNRYLITALFILTGISSLVASLLTGIPAFSITWLSITIIAFCFLWFRRKHLSDTIFILTDWALGAYTILREFLYRPLCPDTFHPYIERVK